MRRDTVPFSAEVLLVCAIFGSIFALVLSGCGRPVDASPPAFVIEKTPSPSCPCGDKCECAELKAKLAEAERENEVNKAVAIRLEEKAAFLDNEIGNLYRPGDKVEHPNGHYVLEWKWVPKPFQQSAIKLKRVQAPNPYMSPCGPGGCPTPSARGFFGRR